MGFLHALVLLTSVYVSVAADNVGGPEDDVILNAIESIHGHLIDLRDYISHVFDEKGLVARTDRWDALSNETEPEDPCLTCIVLLDLLNLAIDEGLTYPDLKPFFYDICMNVSFAGMRGEVMCDGMLDNWGPNLEYIFQRRRGWGNEFCPWINECMDNVTLTAHSGEVISGGRITPAERKMFDPSDYIRVAQITDIHVDAEYGEGSGTDCGLLVCCRDRFDGGGPPARRYGDNNCNIPPLTVELAINFTRSLEPHLAFYTGDNNPGSLWEETQEKQLWGHEYLADVFSRLLQEVPTYPVMGNHEVWPTNLYFLNRSEVREVNARFAEWWNKSVNFPPEQVNNILSGAYYTILAQPGLRVLVYNSNYGYTLNWYNWLLVGDDEFTRMRTWMEDTMNAAREAGEKVLLVGHHPTGDSQSLLSYSYFIEEFVNRHQDVIVFHIFGHYHRDEFKLVWSQDDPSEAVGVQFITPSLTTSRNPTVRMYYLDPDTRRLVDYEQYYLVIDQVSDQEPDISLFTLHYRASDEYDLTDMSPASFQDLLDRMTEDDDLLLRYHHNKYTRNGNQDCDDACRVRTLCSTRHATYDRYLSCVRENGSRN